MKQIKYTETRDDNPDNEMGKSIIKQKTQETKSYQLTQEMNIKAEL